MLGVQLVLTAFLVNLVSISSDQYEPSINSKANYEREMEKSSSSPVPSKLGHDFENFLELVANKEPSGNLREILQEEVANGEQEFDVVNTEMKAMRSQYAERKRSRSRSQKYLTENILPVKREVKEPEKCPVDSTKDHREYEEKFVELYGNFVSSGIWDPLIDMYKDTERLKRICTQAHNKTGRVAGEVKIYRCDQKPLVFSNPNYRSIDMEVIVYQIVGHNKDDGSPRFFYVGKGTTPECLFYLEPREPEEKTFTLGDHVCDITI